MSKYNVPVDFTVVANTSEEIKIIMDDFLLRAVTELRTQFPQIKDYQFPYGYPIEEVPST